MSDTATEATAPDASTKRKDGLVRARRVIRRLSPKDISRVNLMRKNGIFRPTRLLLAAHSAKLPLSLACAALVKEGVAKDDLHRPELLDRFHALSALVAVNGPERGIAAYRGSGADAEKFAKAVLEEQPRWAKLLDDPDPDKPAKPKKKGLNPRDWWKQYVGGDADCKRAVLCALANVAKDLNTKIYIRSGNRTYAEQKALWDAYQAGRGALAARPGTSNHEGGRAADCAIGTSRNGANIGELPGAREAMRRRGLCLPVNGEAWHAELGSRWADN